MSDRLPTARPHDRRSPKAVIGLLLAVVLGVAADLGTKAWAVDQLAGERITNRVTEVCEPGPGGVRAPFERAWQPPILVIEDLLELRYAENCGAAFGFMNTWSKLWRLLVFIPVALGAVLVLGFMYIAGRGGRLLAAAVPLIIAGAIGNFVDRIRYGYVIDFIRFFGETPDPLVGLLGPRWEYPIFNVADIWITIGVVFLLIDGFLEGRRERAALAAAPDAQGGSGGAPDAGGSRGPSHGGDLVQPSALEGDGAGADAIEPDATESQPGAGRTPAEA